MGRISMPQGKGSQMHNRRDYEKIGHPLPDNIDAEKSTENITLVDRDLRQAYRDIFGKALEQYNSSQKREDRKIKDYYAHIQQSKNREKLFYEDVVQWGKKEDFENPATRQKAKEALLQYAATFEQRNPNLKLVGAYIHMDEASPHLHIDYIPVAHGYKRGLSVRNSLDRAMKEMGYMPEQESRKNNATKLWKEHERAHFGEICRGLGLEVEPERQSSRKSLTPEEYKDLKEQELGKLEEEKKELDRILQPYRDLKVDVDKVSVTGVTILPGVVAIKAQDIKVIREQAKAYVAIAPEIAAQRAKNAELAQWEADLKVQSKEISDLQKEMSDLRKENYELKQEVGFLKSFVETISKAIQEELLPYFREGSALYNALSKVAEMLINRRTYQHQYDQGMTRAGQPLFLSAQIHVDIKNSMSPSMPKERDRGRER